MKKLYFLLGLVVFVLPATSQVSLTNLASPYGQDFNTLAATGTSSTLPPGWFIFETGANANDTYVADNGFVNSGNTYSYGTTGSTERALGTLLSGSLTSTIGVGFTNNSIAPITSISVTYAGEQWRLGMAGRSDSLNFQYSTTATSLSTGTWIDVDPLDFKSPNTSAGVGQLDGNATANRQIKSFTIAGISIQPGATFYFRWVDANATGADDGLAVDDLQLTFNNSNLPECTTPTAQPTDLVFSSITNTSVTGTFTVPTPPADRYLVVMSTSPVLSPLPQNGITYNDDDALGNASIVSTGSSNTFTVSGLNPGTTYYFYIFSANTNCSGGPLYNLNSPLAGPVVTTTPPPCVAPTSAPGTITTTAAGTSVNGSFVNASGADGYLVIRSTSPSFAFTPVNGTTYNVGQTAGTGTVVKFSTGNTFSSTGLTTNTTYYFFVYALNGFNCTGGPVYNTNPASTSVTTTSSTTGEPAGYYVSTTGKACADLKTTLKTIVSTGHTPRTYNELWTQYLVSDIKPREVGPGTSPTVIWDVYSDNPTGPDPYNFTPGPTPEGQQDNGTGGNTEGEKYNREHSVPLNWFSGSTGVPGAATDYIHLFPTDKLVNNQRGSYIFGEVAAPTFTSLNGSKLGSSAIAGFTGPVFEPINEYKGDLARAFLYFVTRYEENMPNWPGGLNGTQAFEPNTYPSVDIPYLQLMLKWHQQDPVSPKEIDRNNAAYNYQGNRNPFVDRPEFATQTWNSTCPGLTALPVKLAVFGGKLAGGMVKLEWTVLSEVGFSRYEIERSLNGNTYSKVGEVNASGKSIYAFNDDAEPLRGRRVYYRLKMVDKDGSATYSPVFNIHVPLNTRFGIYPNPATTYFQIQVSKAVTGKIEVSITDLSGKVLQQRSVDGNSNNFKIGTTNLAAGTYLVKMRYGGEQYVQKLVVTK
ncbi:T9SS type A sorting domain-containing protein [Segetibacter sp. 3557_3]|uniref:endonuclease n=1 Tax=Segetibacter sp. 3557_3 TaxID=2547429 RepID=UPI0010586EF6|nr:endonuclease [Segetibacter sp. 3557_3]TDH18374.1 T9SS type A sorting domain-containing protein [Segetibacter sp. 3557_3]